MSVVSTILTLYEIALPWFLHVPYVDTVGSIASSSFPAFLLELRKSIVFSLLSHNHFRPCIIAMSPSFGKWGTGKTNL
jgi:hypothetical protein